jgi:3-hydroxyacyl-CoA dehydrogenase
MKGVEIITGLQTSDETLQRTLALAEKLGKVPSRSVDSPGFLANRLLIPYINEAIICLETVPSLVASLRLGRWPERRYRQHHEEWV